MSNSVIAPAILAENVEQYKDQVDKITGLVERVHIDISDGEFAPTLTVGISELWAPEGWMIDIHAMVNDVAEYVPKLIALRPHMIIIHAEATGDVKTALMIFSGELGRFGGTASLMQLEKIRLIKAINPSVEIGWDGGVAVDNAYSLVQGGVNVLNVGGVIQKSSDPRAIFSRLQQEINKTSVL